MFGLFDGHISGVLRYASYACEKGLDHSNGQNIVTVVETTLDKRLFFSYIPPNLAQ
jgi:hypothetical protein